MSYKAASATELPDRVGRITRAAHERQQRVVLVTGVFDVLHYEHIRFLTKAKATGDVLIVGVESDLRVTKLKGPGRPLNDESSRVRALLKLNLVDAVFILPETFNSQADYRALLQTIKPDVLAVSSHSPHLVSKQRLLAEVGGVVKIVHQHNPAISTTQIVQELDRVPA